MQNIAANVKKGKEAALNNFFLVNFTLLYVEFLCSFGEQSCRYRGRLRVAVAWLIVINASPCFLTEAAHFNEIIVEVCRFDIVLGLIQGLAHTVPYI